MDLESLGNKNSASVAGMNGAGEARMHSTMGRKGHVI